MADLRFQPLTGTTRFGASFIAAAREHGYSGPLVSFSLPAGHSCPYASACKASADRVSGRVSDGLRMTYRCYAATSERYPGVRGSRWTNYDALQAATVDVAPGMQAGALATLILAGLERVRIGADTPAIIRIHPSGDMYSGAYFHAWWNVARARPAALFYVFTKSLPLWIRLLKHVGQPPANLKIIASIGGSHDHLIFEHGLRYSRVIDTLADATFEDLTIDTDDTVAAFGVANIGLPILGTQPPAISLRVKARNT